MPMQNAQANNCLTYLTWLLLGLIAWPFGTIEFEWTFCLGVKIAGPILYVSHLIGTLKSYPIFECSKVVELLSFSENSLPQSN